MTSQGMYSMLLMAAPPGRGSGELGPEALNASSVRRSARLQGLELSNSASITSVTTQVGSDDGQDQIGRFQDDESVCEYNGRNLVQPRAQMGRNATGQQLCPICPIGMKCIIVNCCTTCV